MSAVTNFVYRQITHVGRAVTVAQGLKMRLSGVENIPDEGGAVIVCNHTGYMDFLFGAYLAYQKKRLVRYLAKASVFKAPVVGRLFEVMGHVPVDRIDGGASIVKGTELAKSGELVGVFAEGTISRSFEIRSMRNGAARIAHAAGVPIIPQIIFGSQRLWTKGQKKHLGRTNTPILITALEPYYTTGDADADIAEVRRRMQEALEELWTQYESEFGPMPAGEYWVPARKGGGAPTLEEAEAQDAVVEDERYRVRRLRDDLAHLKGYVSAATIELVRDRMMLKKSAAPEEDAVLADVPSDAAPDNTTESAAADQVKERPRTAPETLEWIKENLNSVVEEATRGLEEGRDKVTEVMAQLKSDVAEAQASMTASGKEIFAGSVVEQGLLSAATQSRLIVSRLPHRVKAEYSAVPRIVVADQSALSMEGGEVSKRLQEALAQVYPQVEELVIISQQGTVLDAAAVEDIPQDVWRIACAEGAEGVQFNDAPGGPVATASSPAEGLAAVVKKIGAEPKDLLFFANEPGDETFAEGDEDVAVHMVALETAPIEVVKAARAVTYSAERFGMAEVLEAMARLQKSKKK
ncbi:lysophospholipid acyltransferase family protein [Corynebacterium minutissimum]|uniref:1-acyl-sn-glycerol-3-phosphate acyltransferase n=1 Tax=Corynebacterium minutissimum TaxID=38301 RepID=A0A2X4R8B1_9CORY|nr:lysophospholipid acyltransferase family protein [Corynebacterium minutissimum]KHO30692.1 acyltransferase [Corynebacterium minutissimum]QPS59832.1 1-acyl-sn-glycerol-3-phosphate acyltransferase [Corynebacterium minutissimum]QQA79377.1 1-acyl-sn-glycerol-3-phosphate acyltransferase [Corynebacterium minutissimum]SQH98339.1 putative acyltransferase [Corynebacterium minutissimum]VEG04557.1 putative acyltransferase [Corynebacterium minutissimum]